MINPNVFAVNQRLEIFLDTDPAAERYSSRIEGIISDQLYIGMPMSKGVPIILLPGAKLYGRIRTANEVWQFTSTFIDKKSSPILMWLISTPYDLKKVQLRSFVRLPVSVPVKFIPLPEEASNSPIATITKDIGGGGLQFVSKVPLKPGSKLHLLVDLPDGGPVEAAGEVVRVEQPQDLNIYWVSAKFIKIPEKERDRIIKFIFKKQSERRQKGL